MLSAINWIPSLAFGLGAIVLGALSLFGILDQPWGAISAALAVIGFILLLIMS